MDGRMQFASAKRDNLYLNEILAMILFPGLDDHRAKPRCRSMILRNTVEVISTPLDELCSCSYQPIQ